MFIALKRSSQASDRLSFGELHLLAVSFFLLLALHVSDQRRLVCPFLDDGVEVVLDRYVQYSEHGDEVKCETFHVFLLFWWELVLVAHLILVLIWQVVSR